MVLFVLRVAGVIVFRIFLHPRKKDETPPEITPETAPEENDKSEE